MQIYSCKVTNLDYFPSCEAMKNWTFEQLQAIRNWIFEQLQSQTFVHFEDEDYEVIRY